MTVINILEILRDANIDFCLKFHPFTAPEMDVNNNCEFAPNILFKMDTKGHASASTVCLLRPCQLSIVIPLRCMERSLWLER